MEKYDLIIVGGGPAGLSAAIYAARYKLKTIVFSKTIGGIAATAHKICNFPGYKEIKGFKLMKNFTDHVKDLEVPILYNEIKDVKKVDKEKGNSAGFIVKTKKGEYFGKKIIFAVGTERRKLEVLGEASLLGKGVSYCATCDSSFFKDKTVAVIGGSDAALTAALLLSEYASKIYIIYRKSNFFRAEPSWIELVEKDKKIESIFNEEIIKINGKGKVESVDLKSGKPLELDGVFIEAGSVPELGFISHLNIKVDEKGYVIVDKIQKTNIEGIYAAGDITNNGLKQIITAGAEGAIAAYNIYQEIKKEENE